MCSKILISTELPPHQNTLITCWCSRMLVLMLIILQQRYQGAKPPIPSMSTASQLSKGNWLQLKKRKNDSFSLPDILPWWPNEVYKIKSVNLPEARNKPVVIGIPIVWMFRCQEANPYITIIFVIMNIHTFKIKQLLVLLLSVNLIQVFYFPKFSNLNMR